MKATVRDLDGDDAGEVDLPEAFETAIRPDLIKRAVLAAQANRKQDYGADEYAGMRTPAESFGSGRGMAHVPREGGQARRVPQPVGGRTAHPPKAEKDRTESINDKERKAAVSSAIAATADADLVAERGERLVDFIIVEILQVQVRSFQNIANSDRRRHQQSLAGDEIERRRLGVREIRQHRQAALARPLLRGQQHRRSAVGQRRRVGRRKRAALRFLECRLQLAHCIKIDVLADIVVAKDSGAGHHEIIHESFLIRGDGFFMAFMGERILLLAADLPFLGHQLAVLAHRKPRPGLAGARRFRRKLGRRKPFKSSKFSLPAAGALQVDEPLGELPLEHHRHVGNGVRTAGDAAFDHARGDLRADAHRRLQAGSARLHHGDSGGGRRQLRAEDRFAGEVPVLGVGDHRAARHFIHVGAGEAEAVRQTVERRGHHVQIGQIGVSGVRAAERGPRAANDRHPPQTVRHGQSLSWPA
jgi:ribosomal protein L4